MIRALTGDGQIRGMSGSALLWLGGNDAAQTLIATGTYPFQGLSVNSGNAGMLFPMTAGVRKFSVGLGAAPGVGNSRTFKIIKNGSPIAASAISFGAAEVGVKSLLFERGQVAFATNDVGYIESTASGAPTASNASWGMVVEPGVPV
jgi:hypothetical protein